MAQPFDFFVILAGMRTGSNFLESNLNSFADLTCYGEAFNPHFIGYPKNDTMLGMTVNERDKDPMRLISAMITQTKGLPGFRFFHDHDPRILKHILENPRCAKVILTRNPVESFVSWRIARETGQWKLTNVKHQRSAKVRFDPAQFAGFLSDNQSFQAEVRHGLQVSGQSLFHVDYDDLQDLDVINGLGLFLGGQTPLDGLQQSLKKQNPGALKDKVSNPEEMENALADTDIFGVGRAPILEPSRGAGVPSYVAAAQAPLLYQPLMGGATQTVLQWMADLDGVTPEDLATGFSQKTLRQWMRRNKGHRVFTVVRHPMARAYQSFCDKILSVQEDAYTDIRAKLQDSFGLKLPKDPHDESYDLAAHRAAFDGFLSFVKANLDRQTVIRVDPAWASQTQLIQGITQVAPPDLVIREHNLSLGLAYLAAETGSDAPVLQSYEVDAPFSLQEVYTDALEKKLRDIYNRDYLNFGFRPWAKSQ